MVAKAKHLGYRGLGLTDHGNIAGSVRLYQECQKAGIKPFPGSELYIVTDRDNKSAPRYHLGVVAFTTEGYRNLVHLSTQSHRNFHHKPLMDMADLAKLSDEGKLKGLAVTTGCFFGLVIQTLVNDGYDAAKQYVAMFKSWFDVCYVELQKHNISQEPMGEDEIVRSLTGIAEDLDLMCVITQDCHYVDRRDKKDHETLKRLVTWADDASEAVFPGDGFHMADDSWIQRHFNEQDLGVDAWSLGMEGLEDLLERWDLHIPEMDEYHPNIPSKHADPSAVLRERCSSVLSSSPQRSNGSEQFGPIRKDGKNHLIPHRKGASKPYWDRLRYELEVIDFNGMASYILLVAEVTDYCRANGIFFQARGSASGSLVCWLMGITPVDPIKWGLLMERFLARDRKKMPDIDLDIQSSRRQELVEYLSMNYSVTQIGTWQELGLGEKQGKGSIWVKVFSRLRKEGRVPSPESLSHDEWKALDGLAVHAPYTSSGKHAGGLLMLGSREDLHRLVPQMWIASSGTMVSQYDMNDVEKIGLVKLDALGLSTMDVLQQTIINLGRDPRDMMDFIPLDDKKTYQMLSKGDSDGVFQLEGMAMRIGIQQMKPKTIEDIVAAVALYRPATMNNGGTEQFIERRFRRQPVPMRHPLLMDATKKTHGILLYQEQMISVLRSLGMSPEELTRVLKAIKASNGNVSNASQVMLDSLATVRRLAAEAGMEGNDVSFLEASLLGYAQYGFNRSHAVVYGITAYRCAYLAANYPVEFHAALLSVASGTDKERVYLSAARRRGVRITRPEINASGVGYRPGEGTITRGFLSIDGVGEKAARSLERNQPYDDLVDFASKVDARSVSGTRDLQRLIKKADGDKEELERLFIDHQFPRVIDALRKARVFRNMVKEPR